MVVSDEFGLLLVVYLMRHRQFKWRLRLIPIAIQQAWDDLELESHCALISALISFINLREIVLVDLGFRIDL